MGDSFQSRSDASPFDQSADPRVGRMASRFRGFMPVEQSAGRLAANPGNASQLYSSALAASGPILFGVVVNALPTLDWYRVQTAEAGFIACCRGRDDAPPLGPRSVGVICVGAAVLVYMPPPVPAAAGVILCVLPPPDYLGKLPGPWLAYGGGTGLKRERFQQYPVTSADSQGGAAIFGPGRAIDETGYDAGQIAETGVGYGSNSFEAYLQAGPFAGLRASLYDQFLSVYGRQLEIFSAAHYFRAGEDEGEPFLYEGEASYPWEARGQRFKTGVLVQQYSDADVQYNKPVGKYDLREAQRDIEPIHRMFRYGGYLGQGGYRAVVLPAAADVPRRRRDVALTNPDAAKAADIGLFRESIGRDGCFSLISAHSVHIGKRLVVSVPRRRYLEADPQGDDAQANNYKAAGTFGDGEPHRVRDPKVPDDAPELLAAASVGDFVARAADWKPNHPFHYHKKDFALLAEGQGKFDKVVEPIDCSDAAKGGPPKPPASHKLQIDGVRGEVDYYAVESGMTLLPDGGVVIREGGGASLVMARGKIYLDAPLGFEIRNGGTLAMLAEQIVLRAKRSVDVSATTNDVRIKAKKNVQIVAGTGGQGGLLLEGRGKGKTQAYDRRVGEEVAASGVVIKAADGVVGILAQDAYIRTLEGDLVLDAAQGASSIHLCASAVAAYVSDGLRIGFGPREGSSKVSATYLFSDQLMQVPADLLVDGKIIGVGQSGMLINGSVNIHGSIACDGGMADSQGWFLGKVDKTYAPELNKAFAALQPGVAAGATAVEAMHAAAIAKTYYRKSQLGDAETIKQIGFSFRDDAKNEQYGTELYETFEPYWQALVRADVLQGLSKDPWIEESVPCQGRETYPWPGKAAWVDQKTMIQAKPMAYDPETGNALRPPPATDPPTDEEADWTMTKADGSLTTIR